MSKTNGSGTGPGKKIVSMRPGRPPNSEGCRTPQYIVVPAVALLDSANEAMQFPALRVRTKARTTVPPESGKTKVPSRWMTFEEGRIVFLRERALLNGHENQNASQSASQ